MKVKELIIDGFKSYSTRTVISSWDPQFNAITGLNGSGKSNILDAICFVLGITSTASLRAQNLLDLIYKKGQAGITKASVTITFDNSDKSTSPMQFLDRDAIMITRQVTINAGQPVSKYSINGTRSTQKDVSLLLQSVQLNINNPNFLIMQGQITKMLNMKPKQVLNLIEEASGTKSYEMQREQSKKLMAKKQKKMDASINTLETQVQPQMKKLENQKGIILEYNNIKLQMENDLSVIQAYDYQEALDKMSTVDKPLQKAKEQYQKLSESVETYENQINALNDQIEVINSQKIAVDTTASKKLEQEEQNLADEITKLNINKEFKQKNLDEVKIELKSKKEELNELKNSDNKDAERLKIAELEFNTEKDKLANFQEVFQRKEDLYSTLSTGFSSKGTTDAGYVSQLRDLTKKVADTRTQIEKDQLHLKHLTSQFDQSKISASRKELESIERGINEKRIQINKLESQLRASGFDETEYQNLKTEERQLIEQLSKKNQALQTLKRQDNRFDFSYQKPHNQFNDAEVRGFCGELFELSPDKSKVATALEVCAGYKLFNIVVDTDRTGSELLERGGLRKRVTIVPLNKITSKVVRPEIVQSAKRMAPDKVELALDLIEYTGDVRKAMEYVFGSKLICDDANTAKMVTFDKNIRTGSITLEGDNYDPEGRLSGGSRRQSSSLIMKFMQYKKVKGEVEHVKQELSRVQRKLKTIQRAAEENSGTQQLFKREKYEIESLEKKLLSSPNAIFLTKYEHSLTEIERLKAAISCSVGKIEELNVEIANIEKDMNEFNSNGASKIEELEQEIKKMKKEMNSKEKIVSEKKFQFTQMQVSFDNSKLEISSLESNIEKLELDIPRLEKDLEAESDEISKIQIQHAEILERIQEDKQRDDGIRSEIEELKNHLQKTKQKLDETKSQQATSLEQVKGLESQIKHYKKIIEESMETVKNDQHRQVILEQNQNANIDELLSRVELYDAKIRELESRGAKQDIISQIDDLQSQANVLRTKINTITKDKKKIMDTIDKLDQQLTAELETTYQKVSQDFGEIFNVLLSGSSAKLVKVNEDNILAGLEVRVRLGNVWKESLVELSGGQRSLVALALIMSLLQFRPAPMYILDEVDAALDLSHTQSIGHLIKTRFKSSQFIVVSLKEGMFTNANRLFRVRFQEGTSVVTAT